ncbi:MAG: 4-(cytidine 5'-diphospho)-2-C-methyl-D-erythritol kinase [Bacteroidia bacterium]
MITLYPPSKINLGLHILGRLPNGYHELETLLFPVEDPRDRLSLQPLDKDECVLFMTGRPISGDTSDNLVAKAWKALKNEIPDLPGVKVHLAKRIPAGAGLGGGSSDAASMLSGLNAMFNLGISLQRLGEIAATLGADVPFFLYQRPMMATGTGTNLKGFELDLSDFRIELITPPIHSSTVEAYRGLNPADFNPKPRLGEILALPAGEWREHLVNDLEKPVFQKYPKLSRIKEELYGRGAVYAAMSGSGSAVFGLFAR